MGLFTRRPRDEARHHTDFVPVKGEQLFVGEASYQQSLIGLLVRRGYAPTTLPDRPTPISERFTARLVPETSNPYDKNAVGVHVEDRLIAYLSRANAARYRTAFGTQQGEMDVVLWVKAESRGIVSVWPAD